MKTLKLISIILILSLASCRSKEMSLSRSKTSEIEKERISLNESSSETVNGVRVVEMRDSSKQFVGLRIYPLDTFSLSVDGGFRGKAKKVEYWGVEERIREGKDSNAVLSKKEYAIENFVEKDRRKDEALKNRVVDKESIWFIGWVLIVGVGMFCFWLRRRSRK